MAVVGSIGDIVFEVSAQLVRTFGEYSDSVAARISPHEVGGSLPVLEFVGPETRAIEISVQLNAAMGVDIETDIARAQEYCQGGKLLGIVIGGKPIGGAGAKWLIESADSTRQQFDLKGVAILAELKLSLKLARIATTPTTIGSTVTKSGTQRVKVS